MWRAVAGRGGLRPHGGGLVPRPARLKDEATDDRRRRRRRGAPWEFASAVKRRRRRRRAGFLDRVPNPARPVKTAPGAVGLLLSGPPKGKSLACLCPNKLGPSLRRLSSSGGSTREQFQNPVRLPELHAKPGRSCRMAPIKLAVVASTAALAPAHASVSASSRSRSLASPPPACSAARRSSRRPPRR